LEIQFGGFRPLADAQLDYRGSVFSIFVRESDFLCKIALGGSISFSVSESSKHLKPNSQAAMPAKGLP
jgi:hypothetical protein